MKIKLSYVICTNQRTGSNLLCQMLRDTQLAGNPQEYFFYIPSSPRPTFEWLKNPTDLNMLTKEIEQNSSSNGVFGIKMMWFQFHYVNILARLIPDFVELEKDVLMSRMFPNLAYIWLIRRNKVYQGVSYWKALQTGGWTSSYRRLAADYTKTPQYNFLRIHSLIQELVTHENAWMWYFNQYKITPLKIVYEDFVDHPQQTIKDIFDYFAIKPPFDLPVMKMERQFDERNEQWASCYIEDCKRYNVDVPNTLDLDCKWNTKE